MEFGFVVPGLDEAEQVSFTSKMPIWNGSNSDVPKVT